MRWPAPITIFPFNITWKKLPLWRFTYRAIFTWAPKVVCVCFVGFSWLRSVIGLKIWQHFLNQSEVEPNPILTRLRTISRASRRLNEFSSSFDCSLDRLCPLRLAWVITLVLGFRHSIENRSNCEANNYWLGEMEGDQVSYIFNRNTALTWCLIFIYTWRISSFNQFVNRNIFFTPMNGGFLEEDY